MNLNEIRIFLFVILSLILLTAEYRFPVLKHSYKIRILHNYLLLALGILLLKLAFPAGLAIVAAKTPTLPWHFQNLPSIVEIILTLIVFDFAIYWQHRLSHKWNWFWQMHSVHHSDASLDFTSAVRFHPLEILVSGFYKLLLISLLGPSVVSFLIYEILLSSFALFNHSNINLPKAWDTKLRKVFVTPNMHYPHHSPKKQLTNMNFGNILSIWDRIFKTYTDTDNQEFGLEDFQADDFKKIIGHPFRYDYFKKN